MRAVRFALLSSSILAASTILLPLAPAEAAQSQIAFNQVHADFDVLADGTYTETDHVEAIINTEAAARQAGQTTYAYDELTTDSIEITEAYTLKADGSKLAVDAGAIYTQAAPGSDTITSIKQKVIVFPRVAAGDRVVYTVKSHLKTPTFAGVFTYANVLPRTVSYNDWTGTITAPSNMPLRLEAHGMSIDEEERGNLVHYRWHYAAPNAIGEEVADVAPIDRDPRVFVSSFASYDDLGRTYAEMIAPALIVTPKIQALADKLTAGITDRRTQAERIYEWVGKNIRYVSIQLGVGGYMPHAADAVLANGYGDCKDHTVLLATLLKAKGIESNIVAINLGTSYTVPGVPSLASFNHVINWLPEFKLYVDSTLGVAPFGALDFSEYGKPVVHAVESGNALHRTPIVAAGRAFARITTTARLDDDGDVSGETTNLGRGPFGVGLRIYGQQIEAEGTGKAAAEILKAAGIEGSGDFDFAPPAKPGAEYKILGKFDYSMPQYLSGAAFTMPSGLRILPAVGDWLMGPLTAAKLRDGEATRCFTGTAVEDASLEIPAGKRLLKLPADITVADAHLRYTARWSFDGDKVTVHRQFSTVVADSLCRGDVRKDVAKSLAKIRQANQMQFLSLVDDGTVAKSASDDKSAANDANSDDTAVN
jgi:transglutaminase-like putative cysteine protease